MNLPYEKHNNILLVPAFIFPLTYIPIPPPTRPVSFAVLGRSFGALLIHYAWIILLYKRLASSIIRDFITMSSSQLDRPVVSTDWLIEKLKNSKGGLVVLDTTWFSDKDACSGFSE